MKKLAGLSLAAALFAATVAPAAAADVEMSGEVRVRHEIMDNYDFNDTLGDSKNATTQRTRLNAKVAVDDRTTAFISLQDTRTWGSETSTATTGDDAQAVDLSQGWLLIKDVVGPVAVKVGRQSFAYGDQRYVGGFEWSDNARRFDALAFVYGSEDFDIHAFFSETGVGTGTAIDSHVNAIYSMWKTLIPANQLDVYLAQIQATGGTDIQTIGLRLAGKAAGADWTAEYIKEGGDSSATVDQDANAFAVTAGYTLADVLGGFRIGAEYTSASGNKSSTSTKNEAFSGGLPTNKFHYGLSGLGGTDKWSNFDAISLNLTAKPANGIKVRAEYWDYTKNEVATTGASDDIGSEINLQLWYDLTEKVKLFAHAAQFSPGKATAPAKDDDATLISLQLHAKF